MIPTYIHKKNNVKLAQIINYKTKSLNNYS